MLTGLSPRLSVTRPKAVQPCAARIVQKLYDRSGSQRSVRAGFMRTIWDTLTNAPSKADGAFAESKALQRYADKLDIINRMDDAMQSWADGDLSAYSALLRDRCAGGETLDALLPEAFALVREACRRRLGKHHYDVQLLGGMALHDGVVAEMATGEGKSLTGVLPAYLNALTGDTVFIATVNDYLAKRDADLFRPVFEMLNMQVTSVSEEQDFALGNVTYITAQQLGFAYLRDLTVFKLSQRYLPSHLGFVIIDEADQVLLDMARTSLILSSPDTASWTKHEQGKARAAMAAATGIVHSQLLMVYLYDIGGALRKRLEVALHTMNEKPTLGQGKSLQKQKELHMLAQRHGLKVDNALTLITISDDNEVNMTALGVAHAIELLRLSAGKHAKCDEFWTGVLWGSYVQQALNAVVRSVRDVDYTIKMGRTGRKQTVLLDAQTGRTLDSTKLENLQHQYLDLKHGLTPEHPTARGCDITYASFFQRFAKVAGMTGTAADVVPIPPNRPCQRVDHPMDLYLHEEDAMGRRRSIIRDALHAGRPLLIGTDSTAESQAVHKFVQSERDGFLRSIQDRRRMLAYTTSPGSCKVNDMDREVQRINDTDIALLNSDRAVQESMLVALAGLPHRITVATSMAGRGTDILLGGDSQQILLLLLARDHNASVLHGEKEDWRLREGNTPYEPTPAAEEVKGWEGTFDMTQAIVRKITDMMGQLLTQHQRLKERHALPFDEILKANVRGAEQGKKAETYTAWLKEITAAAAPLAIEVRELLQNIVHIQLDEVRSHEQMLAKRIPLNDLKKLPKEYAWLPAAAEAELSCKGQDVHLINLVAVLSRHVAEDAVGARRPDGSETALTKLASDAFAWVVLTAVWISWQCTQMRQQVVRRTLEVDGYGQLTGGLTVLQWGITPSLRVEKQMRGRAGRQGDPGQSFVVAHKNDASVVRHFPDIRAMQDLKLSPSWSAALSKQDFSKLTLRSMLSQARARKSLNDLEALRMSKTDDAVIDVWRYIVDEARFEVLRLRRDQELQLFERLLRVWLAEWMQTPRVDAAASEQDQKHVLDETERRRRAPELVPLVDARRHPMKWCLDARLAAHLDPIVNPGNVDLDVYGRETSAELDKLLAWTDDIQRTELIMASPASHMTDPDLLISLNRNAGIDEEAASSAIAKLLKQATVQDGAAWNGRYAAQCLHMVLSGAQVAEQAEALTNYLAQLLTSQLVTKHATLQRGAGGNSAPALEAILKAFDLAWRELVQSIKAIQASVNLTALDQKDPKAEQRAQIAAAFETHFSKLPSLAVLEAFRLAAGIDRQKEPLPSSDSINVSSEATKAMKNYKPRKRRK